MDLRYDRPLLVDGLSCVASLGTTRKVPRVLLINDTVYEFGGAYQLSRLVQRYSDMSGIALNVTVTEADWSEAEPAPVMDGAPLRVNVTAYAAWALAPFTMSALYDEGLLQPLDKLIAVSPYLSRIWLDMPQVFRDTAAIYDGSVVGIPYTAEVPLLFWRRDLFAQLGLSPPATWDEALGLALTLNGTEAACISPAGDTCVQHGFCLDLPLGCFYDGMALAAIWASMVGTYGTRGGLYFDPDTTQPLFTGAAMAESLRTFAALSALGPPAAAACDRMEESYYLQNCAFGLTLTSLFKAYGFAFDGALRGRLGVAMLPGSPRVQNRATGKLEPCTPDSCPYALLVNSSGDGLAALVNRVPFFGHGAISLAVSRRAPPSHALTALRAFTYALDFQDGWPLALDPTTRTTPVRSTHLSPDNIGVWVRAGYERDDTLAFLTAMQASMSHPGLAVSLRARGGVELAAAMAAAATAVVHNGTAPEELLALLAGTYSQMLARYYGGDVALLQQAYRRDIGYRPAPPAAGDAQASGGGSAAPAFGGGGGGGLTRAGVIGVAVASAALAAFALAVAACVLSSSRRRRRLSQRGMGPVAAPGYSPGTSLCITDIESSTQLWEALEPRVMDEALSLHNDCIRGLLPKHAGYECHTEGDSFIMAFPSAAAAVAFALELQVALMYLPWPDVLLEQDSCAAVPHRAAAVAPSPAVASLAAGGSTASITSPAPPHPQPHAHSFPQSLPSYQHQRPRRAAGPEASLPSDPAPGAAPHQRLASPFMSAYAYGGGALPHMRTGEALPGGPAGGGALPPWLPPWTRRNIGGEARLEEGGSEEVASAGSSLPAAQRHVAPSLQGSQREGGGAGQGWEALRALQALAKRQGAAFHLPAGTGLSGHSGPDAAWEGQERLSQPHLQQQRMQRHSHTLREGCPAVRPSEEGASGQDDPGRDWGSRGEDWGRRADGERSGRGPGAGGSGEAASGTPPLLVRAHVDGTSFDGVQGFQDQQSRWYLGGARWLLPAPRAAAPAAASAAEAAPLPCAAAPRPRALPRRSPSASARSALPWSLLSLLSRARSYAGAGGGRLGPPAADELGLAAAEAGSLPVGGGAGSHDASPTMGLSRRGTATLAPRVSGGWSGAPQVSSDWAGAAAGGGAGGGAACGGLPPLYGASSSAALPGPSRSVAHTVDGMLPEVPEEAVEVVAEAEVEAEVEATVVDAGTAEAAGTAEYEGRQGAPHQDAKPPRLDDTPSGGRATQPEQPSAAGAGAGSSGDLPEEDDGSGGGKQRVASAATDGWAGSRTSAQDSEQWPSRATSAGSANIAGLISMKTMLATPTARPPKAAAAAALARNGGVAACGSGLGDLRTSLDAPPSPVLAAGAAAAAARPPLPGMARAPLPLTEGAARLAQDNGIRQQHQQQRHHLDAERPSAGGSGPFSRQPSSCLADDPLLPQRAGPAPPLPPAPPPRSPLGRFPGPTRAAMQPAAPRLSPGNATQLRIRSPSPLATARTSAPVPSHRGRGPSEGVLPAGAVAAEGSFSLPYTKRSGSASSRGRISSGPGGVAPLSRLLPAAAPYAAAAALRFSDPAGSCGAAPAAGAESGAPSGSSHCLAAPAEHEQQLACSRHASRVWASGPNCAGPGAVQPGAAAGHSVRRSPIERGMERARLSFMAVRSAGSLLSLRGGGGGGGGLSVSQAAATSTVVASGALCFRGFRVRVGVCSGLLRGRDVVYRKELSHRTAYAGVCMQLTKLISDAAVGGMVLLSGSAAESLLPLPRRDLPGLALWHKGRFELEAQGAGALLQPTGLRQPSAAYLHPGGRSGRVEPQELYQAMTGALAARQLLLERAPLRTLGQVLPGVLAAPLGRVTLAMVQVVGLSTLREWDPDVTSQALAMLVDRALGLLRAAGGYPAVLEGGLLLAAFTSAPDAVCWLLALEEDLRLHVDWPPELLAHELGDALVVMLPPPGPASPDSAAPADDPRPGGAAAVAAGGASSARLATATVTGAACSLGSWHVAGSDSGTGDDAGARPRPARALPAGQSLGAMAVSIGRLTTHRAGVGSSAPAGRALSGLEPPPPRSLWSGELHRSRSGLGGGATAAAPLMAVVPSPPRSASRRGVPVAPLLAVLEAEVAAAQAEAPVQHLPPPDAAEALPLPPRSAPTVRLPEAEVQSGPRAPGPDVASLPADGSIGSSTLAWPYAHLVPAPASCASTQGIDSRGAAAAGASDSGAAAQGSPARACRKADAPARSAPLPLMSAMLRQRSSSARLPKLRAARAPVPYTATGVLGGPSPPHMGPAASYSPRISLGHPGAVLTRSAVALCRLSLASGPQPHEAGSSRLSLRRLEQLEMQHQHHQHHRSGHITEQQQQLLQQCVLRGLRVRCAAEETTFTQDGSASAAHLYRGQHGGKPYSRLHRLCSSALMGQVLCSQAVAKKVHRAAGAGDAAAVQLRLAPLPRTVAGRLGAAAAAVDGGDAIAAAAAVLRSSAAEADESDLAADFARSSLAGGGAEVLGLPKADAWACSWAQ